MSCKMQSFEDNREISFDDSPRKYHYSTQNSKLHKIQAGRDIIQVVLRIERENGESGANFTDMYLLALDAMVVWLRCCTRIHKILCSKVSIIIHGMILYKSLMAKLSRMTHSYRANISSVSMLDGRDADTAVRKKKKTIETGCIADPNNNRRRLQWVLSL